MRRAGPASSRRRIHHLPVSPVDLVDYLELELARLVGGQGAGEQLSPPLEQLAHHLAQRVELVRLPVLRTAPTERASWLCLQTWERACAVRAGLDCIFYVGLRITICFIRIAMEFADPFSMH